MSYIHSPFVLYHIPVYSPDMLWFQYPQIRISKYTTHNSATIDQCCFSSVHGSATINQHLAHPYRTNGQDGLHIVTECGDFQKLDKDIMMLRVHEKYSRKSVL